MHYKISCPHCGEHVSFEDPALGATVQCPHCQQSLQLTVPSVRTEQNVQGPGPSSRRSGFKALAMIGVMMVVVGLGGACVYSLKQNTLQKLPDSPDTGLVYSTDDRMTVDAPSNEVKNVVIRKTRAFEITLRRNFPVATVWVCELNYLRRQPSARNVDKRLKESLEKCAKLRPDQEIIAMAFLTNSPLGNDAYSGPLVWKPDQQKILSMNR